MENRIYLFCLEYHYNHKILKRNKIDVYLDKYAEILYGENKKISLITARQIYNTNIDEVLEIEQNNIDYVIKKNKY